MILQDASLPLAPTSGSLPEDRVAAIKIRGSGELIASSPAMRSLLQDLEELQDSSVILLQGETGTGKDLLARYLHERAAAGFQPLLAVDPSTLDRARLAAELDVLRPESPGRTLLIREVTELPAELQLLLLEALDSVAAGSGRIVCSTQKDLENEVGTRKFSPALWDRLKQVALRVPPLRERREDLPHLIRHFLQRLADQYGRPPVELMRETWQVLLAHRWEGNVRELRNEIERLVVFAPEDGPVGVTGLSPALQLEPRSRSGARVDPAQRQRSATVGGRRMHRGSGQMTPAAVSAGDRRAELWPGRSRRRWRR